MGLPGRAPSLYSTFTVFVSADSWFQENSSQEKGIYWIEKLRLELQVWHGLGLKCSRGSGFIVIFPLNNLPSWLHIWGLCGSNMAA